MSIPVSLLLWLISAIAVLNGLNDRAYFVVQEEKPLGSELPKVTKFLMPHLQRSGTVHTIIGDADFRDCLAVRAAPNGGRATVRARIDREKLCPRSSPGKCSRSLRIIVLSPSQSEPRRSLYLEFEIADINDHAPSWPEPRVHRLSIAESARPQPLQLPPAEDRDAGQNGRISYRLDSSNDDSAEFALGLGSTTPLLLSPRHELDFERRRNYNFTLIAEDAAPPPHRLSSRLAVLVTVLDTNDNSPKFTSPLFRPLGGPVNETLPVDSVLLTVTANDRDSGINGHITYSLDPMVRGYVRDQFYVEPHTGQVRLRRRLDYDRGHKLFQFSVIAADGTAEPYRLSATASVEIAVADHNDETPQIELYVTLPPRQQPAAGTSSSSSSSISGALTVDVSENLSPDELDLAHVSVLDYDEEDSHFVHCFLDNRAVFKLLPDSVKPRAFTLSALHHFDREKSAVERVRITCEDKAKNSNSRLVQVNVIDQNDNAPRFEHIFEFNVEENQPQRYQAIGRIRAVDDDAGVNSKLSYRIVSVQPTNGYLSSATNDQGEFRLDERSGQLFAQQKLDREQQSQYNLTVLAIDGGKPALTGTGSVTVRVLDVNDHPPRFNSPEYKFSIMEDVEKGTRVGNVRATDSDEGKNAVISYHFMKESPIYGFKRTNRLERFYINSANGQITTLADLDREARSSYLLIVEAFNSESSRGSSGFSGSTSVHIRIEDANDNAPSFFAPANLTVIQLDSDRAVGSEMAHFRAKDKDEGKNGQLLYSIVRTSSILGSGGGVSGGGGGLFNLDAASGILFLARKVGPEELGQHSVTVRACDNGQPRLCSEELRVVISAANRPSATYVDTGNVDYGGSPSLSKSNSVIESNSAIIACLVVIFVILIMAMLVMFFLIRNKHVFTKRRDDDIKSNTADIQVRHSEYSYNKKDNSSVYEGDFLLLGERGKMNNLLMQNSRYSPKIYGEARLNNQGAESPCYRTVDPQAAQMASSVYNPVLVLAAPHAGADIYGTTSGVPSQHHHHHHSRGASEPVYSCGSDSRYSNLSSVDRGSLSPEPRFFPSSVSYYQQAVAPGGGSSTMRLCATTKRQQQQHQQQQQQQQQPQQHGVSPAVGPGQPGAVIVNFHSPRHHNNPDSAVAEDVHLNSRTLPRSSSLARFYEKNNNVRLASTSHHAGLSATPLSGGDSPPTTAAAAAAGNLEASCKSDLQNFPADEDTSVVINNNRSKYAYEAMREASFI